ncbi:MAG: sulfate permease [Bacteroidales bacterium]|nr:sulfate permease [Bacteroidales bacterium]MBQ7818120.1 sulfate permease [Bacteroidales bacterium]
MELKSLLKTVDFEPSLFKALKNYNKKKFISDLMAGVIVGVVAMPLAIAFGIASGVTPEAGLITAIIGGFIVSFLGGSSVQIGGPTGAFIIIVAGIIAQYGMEGLAIATLLAGVMLLVMGLCRFGAIIKFIPYPIVIGFTGGIAVTIFSTQIEDFFGMHIENLPADFFSKWGAYFQNIGSTHIATLLVGVATLLIIMFTPKITKRIPGSLVAIILVTIVVYLLKTFAGLEGVDTIGDRFGTITANIKAPEGFVLNWEVINNLISPAFTIAMLGAIESLLSATVADGVIGERHNSNTELIAQGAANIVSPLFGGIPVTGAIARTMTNINNGGRTPIAGIIHAVVLLLILLLLAPLAVHIPMSCLAAILIVVAYNMSGWRTIRSLSKVKNADVIVLWLTLLLTVVFNLNIAIEIGLLLAVILFLKRVTENVHVSVIRKDLNLDDDDHNLATLEEEHLKLEKGVEVYEIDGPFFFGIANKFDEQMRVLSEKPLVRILRMRKVPFIDSTGLHNLEIFIDSAHKEGIRIILSGVHKSVHETLKKGGITKHMQPENICDNIRDAVAKANAYVTSYKEQ